MGSIPYRVPVTMSTELLTNFNMPLQIYPAMNRWWPKSSPRTALIHPTRRVSCSGTVSAILPGLHLLALRAKTESCLFTGALRELRQHWFRCRVPPFLTGFHCIKAEQHTAHLFPLRAPRIPGCRLAAALTWDLEARVPM